MGKIKKSFEKWLNEEDTFNNYVRPIKKTDKQRLKDLEKFKTNLWWRIPLGLFLLWLAFQLGKMAIQG